MPSFPALPGLNTVQRGVPPRSNGADPRATGTPAVVPAGLGGTAGPSEASPVQVGSPPGPANTGVEPAAATPTRDRSAHYLTAAAAPDAPPGPVDLYPGMDVPGRYRATPFDQLPPVMQAKLSRERRPSP